MDGKEEARILQLLDDTLSSDDSSNNSEQDNDKDSIYMPASNSSDSDSDEVENVYDELVSDLHSLQPISTSSYCQSEVVQEEVGTSISTTGIDFPNKVVGLLDDMSTGFTNTDIDSQSEVVIDEVGVSIATNGIDTQSEVVLEEMIIITDSIDYQSEVVVVEVGNVIFDIQANPSNMLTDNECEVVEETISLELTSKSDHSYTTANENLNGSRKRKVSKQKWKSEVRKKNRQCGDEYIDRKGNLRPRREVKKTCSCKFKCYNKISDETRKQIHDEFWKLNDDKKNHFYAKFIQRKIKSRQRTLNNSRKKMFSYEYKFSINDNYINVCKTFFLNTLDISQRRVYYFFENVFNPECGTVGRSPCKGKSTKSHIDDKRKEEIRIHIQSFPHIESHYCREGSKRHFLEGHLNVSKMYKLYTEKVAHPLKENIYRDIFNKEFNLGFISPKKDRCDYCEEMKANPEVSSDKKAFFEKHMENKSVCKIERDEDRHNYNYKNRNNSTAVVCFDLENVFALPRAEVSNFFYKRKFNFYNLTAHCSVDNKSYCALWHECKSGRSGNDIASALVQILTEIMKDHATLEKIILWSDSCIPQNRNSIMCLALKKFLSSIASGRLTVIEQKFSEPGHGNIQEVDSVHSVIERWLKGREVYSPVSLIRLLNGLVKSGKLMKLIHMSNEYFFNFQAAANNLQFSRVPFARVKHLVIKKVSPLLIEFRESFKDDLKSVTLMEKKIIRTSREATSSSLEKEYMEQLLPVVRRLSCIKSLTEEKKKDILSMLKYMPKEDAFFYRSLFSKNLK